MDHRMRQRVQIYSTRALVRSAKFSRGMILVGIAVMMVPVTSRRRIGSEIVMIEKRGVPV
ncbi:hypothetical protein BES08_06340 [Novosphingobium resinovorum]|uniref:Uncharacterized protein n=1 Tax=Novosphingobium resinovorum TaxID=158500 RepID=A0A1D8A2V9_9SPHN|nr:hypothetical protein BES08_06340 [Novosphingobium resinovorum]